MSRKQSDNSQQPGNEQVVVSGWLVGGVIVLIGGALFYFGGKYARISGFDWVQMGGVFFLAIGAMVMFSGDITRASAIEWLRSLGIAVGIALLIRWPIAEPFRIPSGSMLPTFYGEEGLLKGDRVFVNKWVYGVRYPFMNKRIWYGRPPERWDIVVFKAVEPNAEHPTLVKRIVGMPGERINIHGGRVFRVFREGEPVPAPEAAPDLDFVSAEHVERPGAAPELHVPLRIPDFMPPDQEYVAPPGYMSGMMYGIRPEDKYALIPEGHYLLLGDNSRNSRDGRYWGWVPNENIVGRVSCIWFPPARWRDFTGFSKTWWWRSLLAVLGVLLLVRLLIGRSYAVHADNGSGVEHVYVDFLGLGLRIPCTRFWAAYWGRVSRGDTVVYWARPGESAEPVLLIGRVAGLPGEKVVIENGRLHIDDVPVAAPAALAEARYVLNSPEAKYGRSKSKQHSVVPEGHYFVLADHDESDQPLDSRTVGWVPRRALAGKPRAVWWPPRRWRRIR